jgi:hypothetical protein
LNLAQGFAPTEESNGANQTSSGQRLEKCPRRVVKEEDGLHGDDAAKEQGVGDGSRVHGLGYVADIGADEQPRTDECRQTDQDSQSEKSGKKGGGRLGVFAEDVVNFGQLAVAKRRLGCAERHIGVAGYNQVEDMGIVGVGRTERGEQKLGLDGSVGGEELEGEILLRLDACQLGCSNGWEMKCSVQARLWPCRSP